MINLAVAYLLIGFMFAYGLHKSVPKVVQDRFSKPAIVGAISVIATIWPLAFMLCMVKAGENRNG
jgi:hypothetical protein